MANPDDKVEASLAGWTYVKVALDLPAQGPEGRPVIVKDGAALQPGSASIEAVVDYVVSPNSGKISLGRGQDHFVAKVRGVGFCQAGSCYDVYGLSQDPEASRLLLEGKYRGFIGSFLQVFSGDYQRFPDLVCEGMPNLASLVNETPAEITLADAATAAMEGVKQLQSGKDIFCTGDVIQTDLPKNPLDLVREVFVESSVTVQSATVQQEGQQLAFRPGTNNQATLLYHLNRSEGGSLQGSFATSAESHPASFKEANNFSFKGNIDVKDVVAGNFKPVNTLADLVSLLLPTPASPARPSDLLGEVYAAPVVRTSGELKFTYWRDKKDFKGIVVTDEMGKVVREEIVVTLEKGQKDSVFSLPAKMMGVGGQTWQDDIRAEACWDFGGIKIKLAEDAPDFSSISKAIPGSPRGCLKTGDRKVLAVGLGDQVVEPGAHIKAHFDGYRLASVDLTINAGVDLQDLPFPTKRARVGGPWAAYHLADFAGQVVGRIRLVNTQTNSWEKPAFIFAKGGTELRLLNGSLKLRPDPDLEGQIYQIDPQAHVSLNFEEGEDGAVEFRVTSERLLDTNGYAVSLNGTLGLRDEKGGSLSWQEFVIGGQKVIGFDPRAIHDPLLKLYFTVVNKLTSHPGDKKMPNLFFIDGKLDYSKDAKGKNDSDAYNFVNHAIKANQPAP